MFKLELFKFKHRALNSALNGALKRQFYTFKENVTGPSFNNDTAMSAPNSPV